MPGISTIRKDVHPMMEQSERRYNHHEMSDLLAGVLAVMREPAATMPDQAARIVDRAEAVAILQSLWRQPVTRPLVRAAVATDQRDAM